MEHAVAYVLVETGLHAGARLELHDAQVWYSVGGMVDAEYWLADAELADAKAEFRRAGSTLEVRLVSGPPMLLDAASIEAGGEPVPFTKPLLWGGVSFRAAVMPKPAEAPADKPAVPSGQRAALAGVLAGGRRVLGNRRAVSMVLALAAIMVPAAIVLALLSSLLQEHRSQDLQRQALSAQQDPQVQLQRAKAAAQRLSDLIGSPAVSVSALDSKTLAVFGSRVPSSLRDQIQAAASQFEHDFTVRDHVAYLAEGVPHAALLTHLPDGIDLVQYGPHGFLRGHDGRLYLNGGVLPDGMQVDLIRDGEVLLSRGNERAVLRAGVDNP